MRSELRTKISGFLLVCVFVVFAVFNASADELYGRLRGTVTDASGAVVPSADIRLTNEGTGVSIQTSSASDGSYQFINLKPGSYTLVGSKSSFKNFEVKAIHVAQAQIFVQNVSLELGGVTETIEVQANPAQVEQTSMQLTATINSSTITNLPLNGRNWVTLQQTLPGVVLPDTRFGTNYSTNGSQAQQNAYLINGNDYNDLPLNSPLAAPNPDTIAEVKMVTNTINPEYGRNSGAVMNAVTKSGTNNFHGTAFEFYRDTFLNTKNFFQLTPSVFHQNQFGGTIGGPVWKNKAFFFYGLQLTRNRVPDTNFAGLGAITVFSQDQLNGNWDPSVLSSNPIPFPGGVQGPNGPCAQNTAWNDCFTNGVVPTSNYNSLATQLVQKFVPLPNFGGNQYSFNPVTTGKTNQHVGRFDVNFGQKDAVWFYAFANDQTTLNDIPFTGATLPGFGDGSIPYTKQFTASWNHTFSPSILNELRLGYTRLNFATGQPQKVVQPADVGFSNIVAQLPGGSSYPNMALTGYFTLGGTTSGPQPRKDQTYQVTDNFSWVKGRHSFKFGYDGRRFQVWNPFAASNSGAFTFDSGGQYSTGDAGLDFLLGIPSDYNQGSGLQIIAQAHEHYFYGQDLWRVRDNLTLTFGLGYQIDTPLEEFQNKGLSRVCFRPGQQSSVFPTAPDGYLFPGDGDCNRYGGASTKYDHVGPRAGFAWSPGWGGGSGGHALMSIRGGFGLYFNRSEEELNLQDLGDPPFGLTSSGVGDIGLSPSFPDPWADIAGGGSLPNKFPYAPPGPGATPDFAPLEPFLISVADKNLTTPYAMNWNLTLEREFPGETLLRIGYVGSHAENLFTSYSFNPTTPAGVAACLADPNNTLNGGTEGCVDDRIIQPLLFPDHYQYPGDIYANSGIQTNGGWSNYHSLQVTVDKRFSHGLQFLSAYTWAHALDVSSSFEDTSFQAAGGVDPYGRFQRDYGSSAFDARQRWVFSFSYDIPSLHHVWAAVPGRLVEGWRLAGINAIQTGFPINFQDSSYRSLTCTGAVSFYGCPDRPDIVSTPRALDPRTASFNDLTHYWFDPSTMTHNAFGTLGTVPRGYFRGPGYWNADFSIQKDTTITEGKIIQLRLEAFNVFNHTNFANPSGNVNSVNFGRITAIRSQTNSRLVQLGAKFIF